MATTITIEDSDVQAAANFLEQFLSDNVTDGDFTRGTALRDLAVGALASVFAFMTADAAQVRQMQSLKSVQEATGGDSEALRDAVVAILSNAFIALKDGTKARGIALAHASESSDIFIQPTHQFTRSPGLVFVVDSDTTYFIPKNQLVPIIDASGAVLEYQFNIPLVAVKTGDTYNVDPGLFTAFDRFNPFITRIENTNKFESGKGPESVDEVLERAPTAISVRNLINERSITAVLDENFPETRNVFVAGMGTPEMQRDILRDVASSLLPHIGGCVDIYLLVDLVETSFTGEVGAEFERPDGIVCIFSDASADFSSVEEGDIIRVTAGFPNVPCTFLVEKNLGATLVINERTPFPLASDETTDNVSYTIGRIAPSFNDVLSDVGGIPLTTGVTSRKVATPGRITLPGGPVMEILDVAVLNPPGGEAGLANPADSYVHFNVHVNGNPDNTITDPDALQFSTTINNPLVAQSAQQFMEVQVGPGGNLGRWDGTQLRVRYRTLAGFANIDRFVTSPTERTVCASQLSRGHNPITVRLIDNATQQGTLFYNLNPTAPAQLDDTVLTQSVIAYINSFDTAAVPIDVSGIGQFLRDTYPTISAILPFSIEYVLLAPTGMLMTYQTSSIVRIDPTLQTAGPTDDLTIYGVTDRTVRYLANTEGIMVQRKVG